MKPKFLVTLFIPYLISIFLTELPIISYSVAWLGSFYIFYNTWITYGKHYTHGISIAQQIMQPIFLIQAIFAGFMCGTSIFYFYEIYHQSLINQKLITELILTAKSQQYSLLAHIALVIGITIFTPVKQQENNKIFSPKLYIQLAIACYILSYIFNFINGLNQFAIYLNNIATMAGVFILSASIKQKNKSLIWIGLAFFAYTFINASLTGFKESIITMIVILFALLFPIYKKAIIILSMPTVYVMVYILPTYAGIVRQQAWFGETAIEDARNMALEQIFDENNQEQIKETNWQFLTNRASEISMFNQFIKHVPQNHPFYHFEIIENSLYSLIPRVLWPSKPITETIAMERVYEAGVIDRNSIASAKTRPVVDGYLSFGTFGVFITILLYGCFCQWAFNKTESLFGSYELGGIVIFNGAFQGLWRGNNFEFIVNNMFYGLLTVYLLHISLKYLKIAPEKHLIK